MYRRRQPEIGHELAWIGEAREITQFGNRRRGLTKAISPIVHSAATFNVAVIKGEAEVQPDRVLDDRRREGMSTIGEGRHDKSQPPGGRCPLRYRDNAAGKTALGGRVP
jgi:hypothetical protein